MHDWLFPDHPVDFMFVKQSTVALYNSTALITAQTPTPTPSFLPQQQEERTPQEEIPTRNPALEFISNLFATGKEVLWISDSMLFAGLLVSIPLRPDPLLVTYTIGSLMLSYPCSLYVNHVAKNNTFRNAFAIEAALNATSFIWICGGLVIIGNSNAIDFAPLLWWPAYTGAILSMSLMGVGIFCIVSASVITIINTKN